MKIAQPQSLRERKKLQLRNRIIETTLAMMREQPFGDISPDEIAQRAEVGRATFFRYFESKEAAAVAGFYEGRLNDMVALLKQAPVDLAPFEMLIWAFGELVESDYRNQNDKVLLLANALNSSPSLRAKVIDYQSNYEAALAEALAHRFQGRRKQDWRPQLLAAAVVAVVRTVMQNWAAAGATGNLPVLVRDALLQLRHGFQNADSIAN